MTQIELGIRACVVHIGEHVSETWLLENTDHLYGITVTTSILIIPSVLAVNKQQSH